MGNSSKEASKAPKKRIGEPPPVDKLVKPAICIGLAMLVYQFIKGINTEVGTNVALKLSIVLPAIRCRQARVRDQSRRSHL